MARFRNKFASPKYLEETILNSDGATIGTIRIKPSGVLWRPVGQRQYYLVPLQKFAEWITSPNVATRAKN